MRRRILFIQHAGGLGGSANSLLYTMQALDPARFEPLVALARPSSELEAIYVKAGFGTIPCEGMVLWDHSTVAPKPIFNPLSWLHLAQVWLGWEQTRKVTLNLIKTVKPDIVHLNSMPLSPCADILNSEGFPFVWHVREPPPDQGLRTRMIRRIMLQAKNLIFLSEYDRRAWIGDTEATVVNNFVDFNTFNRDRDGTEARKNLGLEPGKKVVLYLGGMAKAKGITVLIKALTHLNKKFPGFVCLMPGSQLNPPASWKGHLARRLLPLLGSGTLAQQTIRTILERGLSDHLRLMPFSDDIPGLLAASDVLVFPATQPHFARPIIEAAAMGKPSIGTNLGGIDELIQDGQTGLLVKPDSPDDLAAALHDLFSSPDKSARLGQNAFREAQKKYDAINQTAKIAVIYDSISAKPQLMS